MPPLYYDVRGNDGEDFEPVGYVSRGSKPDTLSNNNPDGTRGLVVCECAPDDSSSTVRVAQIAEGVGKKTKAIPPLSKNDQVHTLRDGDEPLILEIRTDNSPNLPIQVRFTHRRE